MGEAQTHTPFGALPIYEESELRFSQTQAIYRHIARTRDLYGCDGIEHVECDVGAEALNEAIENFWRFFWEPDYARKVEIFERGALAETLLDPERWFTRASHAPRFWIDDRLTYVDFIAWRYLDALFPTALAARPTLAAFHSAFQSRPRIAAYLLSKRRPRHSASASTA